MPAIYESKRRFQIWSYNVSHQQLLLRSVKNSDTPKRLDVLFVGVDKMDLPTAFTELKVSQKNKAYTLSGQNWKGEITAAGFDWTEDEFDYFDDSTIYMAEGKISNFEYRLNK